MRASGATLNTMTLGGLAIALGALVDDGVIGAISGRAIYEGTLDFAEARKIAEQY